MNRIEEIKQRLDNLSKRGLEGYEAKEHFQVNSEADIEYLLSKLEEVEKAFQEEKQDHRKTFSKMVAVQLALNSLNLSMPEPESCTFSTDEEKEDYIEAIVLARKVL